MAIKLEYSTTAKCRPEHVWQRFAKLEEWAWWNPVVGKTAWLKGEPWKNDSQFLMEIVRPVKVTFKPVIIESAPPGRIAWVGSVPGFTGKHFFDFKAQPDGNTLLHTWEEDSGLLTFLWGEGRRKSLTDMHADWLNSLKAEAEKIAREEYARS
ncbi:MAG TPA: SRPBCC family protein [Terriglobales bacterium]|nr:SRPBCC family protein [Terriglobales bacterium]